MGDRSYDRDWHGDTWRARQSPRRAGPLYLALKAYTAIREYQQVSPLMPPGTLVSYTVSAKAMVDFRRGIGSMTQSPFREEFYCNWRELWFNQRVEPPSLGAGRRSSGRGSEGHPVRVADRAGRHQLGALQRDAECHEALTFHHLAGALPKNQDSWR